VTNIVALELLDELIPRDADRSEPAILDHASRRRDRRSRSNVELVGGADPIERRVRRLRIALPRSRPMR